MYVGQHEDNNVMLAFVAETSHLVPSLQGGTCVRSLPHIRRVVLLLLPFTRKNLIFLNSLQISRIHFVCAFDEDTTLWSDVPRLPPLAQLWAGDTTGLEHSPPQVGEN